MTRPEIRPYRPADRAALYRICLLTGDSGGDATGRYADPDLLGHVYVGPYLALAPHLAFVVDDGAGTPLGYALGVADTAAFQAACEQSWWPPLRARYPDPAAVPPAERSPDQQLAHLLHHRDPTPAAVAQGYPAHLHIDLLPAVQGHGFGRRLMARLLAALAAQGAPGVHLGVAPDNQRAIGFYRRLGFVEIEPCVFALRLGAGDGPTCGATAGRAGPAPS